MPHTFDDDIDEIAQDLIDAFNLTFEEEDQNLKDPLIRWLDYRLRHIDASPRQTLKSIDFDQRVPADSLAALNAFIALSESGGDLNPFQTKTIKRNDTSGIKRQLRTDGLWADWGIHHAHLTEVPVPAGEEFSDRSEWLVFFLVFPDQLALIDVRLHNEKGIFQAVDLVEKVIRSWPEIAKRFEVKGVVGLARQPATDAESVKQLRRGVTQMLEVDGTVYMPPGMGVTTAATSTRVSLARNRLKTMARDVGKAMLEPSSPIMIAAAAENVTDPMLSLRVLPNGFLTIVSERPALQAPFSASLAEGDARREIQQTLVPPAWAGSRLVAHLQSTQSAAGLPGGTP